MSFSPSPLSPAQAQTSSDDDYVPSPTPTGSSSPSLNQDQEPASSSIWSHESGNLTPPGRRKHKENISDRTRIALRELHQDMYGYTTPVCLVTQKPFGHQISHCIPKASKPDDVSHLLALPVQQLILSH